VIKEKKLGLKRYLNNHDSYNALKKVNSVIMTGRTGTNVNDIAIICRLK
jgi:glycerate 2-kinase